MFIICAIQIVQEKIDEIFHEYRRMMLSLAYSIVGDSFLTEDAVQEAFIHLNKHAKRFKDTKSKECRNFVYTVTKNEALKILEREKIKSIFEKDVQFNGESGLSNIEGQLDIDAFCDQYGFSLELADVIRSLGETDRDIIIYKYGAGYSLKEIADIMELNYDAVSKRHQRALKKVKTVLENGNE